MGKERIVKVKKLMGEYIITKELEADTTTNFLFTPESKRDVRVKKLKVIQGNERVDSGETICVPINTGANDKINGEDYLIVDTREIIYIQ